MTKEEFKNLKIGNGYLCDGIFEVVKEYDECHSWVTVKEVIVDEEDSEKYTLSDAEYHHTYGDVTRAEKMF